MLRHSPHELPLRMQYGSNTLKYTLTVSTKAKYPWHTAQLLRENTQVYKEDLTIDVHGHLVYSRPNSEPTQLLPTNGYTSYIYLYSTIATQWCNNITPPQGWTVSIHRVKEHNIMTSEQKCTVIIIKISLAVSSTK